MKNTLVCVAWLLGCVASGLWAQALPSGTTNLPIMHLRTHGSEVNSESAITVDVGITDMGVNVFTDSWNAFMAKAGLKLHGTSSQRSDMLKKSYSLELLDSTGAELKAGLLGMSPESDWILVASYNDKSQLRNALGYTLATYTGHYAPRTRFVELEIDNKYQGLYLLVEKIKRDSLRVDVAKLDADDNAGDSLTGGYILRIDRSDDGNGWNSKSCSRVYWQHYYPKDSKITSQQRSYIQTYIKNFESMMMGSNYADSVLGYPAWIAERSFADYVLSQELMRNIDAYRLSAFFYKEKKGKLHAGPVWDMDISTGNSDYYDGANPHKWAYTFKADTVISTYEPFAIPSWWPRLIEEPTFHQYLTCRWQGLRQEAWSDTRLFATFDSLRTVISDAQVTNFKRWNILGSYVWPNAYIGDTWEEEVDSLRNWMGARVAWLDQQFSKTCATPILTSLRSPQAAVANNSFRQQGRWLQWNSRPERVELRSVSGRLSRQIPVGLQSDLRSLPSGTWMVRWTDTRRNVHTRMIALP